jgi:hypothetical protein
MVPVYSKQNWALEPQVNLDIEKYINIPKNRSENVKSLEQKLFYY